MPTFGDGVPNRGTSEMSLDQWNQAMRASGVYQSWMQQNGLPTDGRVQLSRAQQGAFEQYLLSKGIRIPAGMHIDQGGNLNQENKLGRNVAIGAAATLGHSQVSLTLNTYSHVLPALQEDAAAKMDAILSRS